MYLLDTKVAAELRPAKRHGGVVAWLRGVADAELHLAAVTLGEIQAGIKIAREQDAAKAAAIEAWLELVAGNLGRAGGERAGVPRLGAADARTGRPADRR